MDQRNAGQFMASVVRKLADKRPDLCDGSGRGFWPVPAVFPEILSRCIYELQRKTTKAYLSVRCDNANLLAEVRVLLIEIVSAGDLGENHTALFLSDHPAVRKSRVQLPFAGFCDSAIRLTNPIEALGLIARNEEGSVQEIRSLVKTGLIREGRFSSKHLVEERNHRKVSNNIRRILKDSSFYPEFVRGMNLHDKLYCAVL